METLLVTHREGDGKTEQMVVNQDLGVGIVGQEKKMFHKNTSDMSGLMQTKEHGTNLCGSQRRHPQPLHGLLSVPTFQLCCDQRLEDDHDSH